MKLKDLIKEKFPDAIVPELMISLQLDKRIQDLYNSGDKNKLNRLENKKSKIIKMLADKTTKLYKSNDMFKRKMNKQDPRDDYNMFINHWLDAELKRL